MIRRRRLAIPAAAVTTAAAGLVLLADPPAGAVDVWSNVGPASQLPSGALADAYPLGAYALDHHFSAVEAGVFSGVDVSGIAPTVAWLFSNLLWQLTALLANTVITLFTFAFSLDLVNGSAATGGAGALGPVSDAVRSISRDVFGQAWMTVAVLLAGMWSMWNALVRRRYTETAGALTLSLLCVVIALAFVTQPERTIGTASRWTNEISTAFLTLTSDGQLGDAQRSKLDASDHLFELLVYRPWVVLQFGGLEHCVRNAGSDDPIDVPVRPLAADPDRDAQLARQLARSPQIEADDGKVCVNNRLKYAPHFLRFEPGSDQRDAEYEALKDGDSSKLPDEDPDKDDSAYRLGPVDKPAAEAMQKSGQYERLGLAIVIFAGELGVFMLLGSLAVSVIVAQVLVLLLLAFAPVALVIGTFPGRGHQFFLDWLTRLATFLLRKAYASLILAVLLAVSAALQTATSNLGWLMAFGLQAVFFWSVFLNRKQLTGQLGSTITGASGHRDETRLLAGIGAGYAMGRTLRRTFGGITKVAGGGPPATARRRRAPPPPEASPPEPPALMPPSGGGQPPHTPPSSGPGAAGQQSDPRPHGTSDRADAADAAIAGRVPPAAVAPARRSADPVHRDEETDAGSASVDMRETSPPPSPQETIVRDAAHRSRRPRQKTDAPSRTDEPPRPDAPHPAAPRATEATPKAEPAPPERPRPASAKRSSRQAETGDNALLSSLRADARRLHHDAQRVHRDAQQLSDATNEPRPRASGASAPRVRRIDRRSDAR